MQVFTLSKNKKSRSQLYVHIQTAREKQEASQQPAGFTPQQQKVLQHTHRQCMTDSNPLRPERGHCSKAEANAGVLCTPPPCCRLYEFSNGTWHGILHAQGGPITKGKLSTLYLRQVPPRMHTQYRRRSTSASSRCGSVSSPQDPPSCVLGS